MPVLATLEELDEEALMQILTEPKNALTRQYQYLFEMENVDLLFEDSALRAVAKRALERKYRRTWSTFYFRKYFA